MWGWEKLEWKDLLLHWLFCWFSGGCAWLLTAIPLPVYSAQARSSPCAWPDFRWLLHNHSSTAGEKDVDTSIYIYIQTLRQINQFLSKTTRSPWDKSGWVFNSICKVVSLRVYQGRWGLKIAPTGQRRICFVLESHSLDTFTTHTGTHL